MSRATTKDTFHFQKFKTVFAISHLVENTVFYILSNRTIPHITLKSLEDVFKWMVGEMRSVKSMEYPIVIYIFDYTNKSVHA